MNLSRIDRVYGYLTLAATLANGTPADIDQPSLSLLPVREQPDEGTDWIPAERVAGYLIVDKDWRIMSTHASFAEAFAAWEPSSGSKVASRWRKLFAGFQADPAGALVVPAGGADLWALETDSPEVQAMKVERITVA